LVQIDTFTTFFPLVRCRIILNIELPLKTSPQILPPCLNFLLCNNLNDFLLCIVFDLILLFQFAKFISVLTKNKYTVCRYLAIGNRFISLHYEYHLGTTTVIEIVRDTCGTIWDRLNPVYISARDRNDWIFTTNEFNERTNFPNCLGAVDGTHITIRKPKKSRSQFLLTRTFSQRSSCVWQMQSVVSYQ
jgi:hypothetical protein